MRIENNKRGEESIKLDFSISSPEERKALVELILQENPNPTNQYLEILADYLVLCMEKKERQEKQILTPNRMVTVNKRETSFEGLAASMEGGEDSIYTIITNDKNIIFSPKTCITKHDVKSIPPLREVRQVIAYWENKLKYARGKDAFLIKKTLIDFRKDQYVIKNDWLKPIVMRKVAKTVNEIPLNDRVTMVNGEPQWQGVSLLDKKTVSQMLCLYADLKMDSWDNYQGDLWYVVYDLELLVDKALQKFPLYLRLVEYKIDGKQNLEIQALLEQEFEIKHSVEYISNLWRKKIPTLIANRAQEEYIVWYYTFVEKGQWKKCTRCEQIKLAHNRFFSKNKTSKDGYYTICKECRNTKKPKKKG